MKFFLKSFIIILVIFSTSYQAQKIGVVDTEYILDKIPEYKDAEARLNTQIETWKTNLQNLQSEYDRKKAAFDNERVLLIGDQLKQREKEVLDLEKNIKTTTSLRFSSNGEINQLRKNLVEPFQDKIWNAMKVISEKNGLGIVLDKSNNVNVIFLQKRYDYTDKVLDYLLKGDAASKKNAEKERKIKEKENKTK
ncbi:MAG: OmpH family outer membrane protein [Bacteroidetes bacterium]|nr:OmpH family outer membrane protein [Bacteroidota bacterium]